MNTKPRSRAAAFTLIELLVAMTIIIILTVLAVPALGPMLAVGGVEGAAATLKGALVHARSTAIAEHRTSMCWVASGSVIDSGTVQLLSAESELIVDNADTQASDPDNYFDPGTATYTNSSSTLNNEHGTTYNWVRRQGYPGPAPAITSRWHFKVPEPTGMEDQDVTLQVYAWWPDGALYFPPGGEVPHRVVSKGGVSADIPIDQSLRPAGGAGADSATDPWESLGTFTFTCGQSYEVQMDNLPAYISDADGKSVFADAIQITGMPGGAVDAATKFEALDESEQAKTWETDKWSEAAENEPRYYVTLANRKAGTTPYTIQPATAPIKSNQNTGDSNIVTIGTTWAAASAGADAFAAPTPGSQFLIHLGNPGQTGVRQQSVGSGTEAAMRWDVLPEGFAVRPTDPVTGDNVLPLSFEPNGRARIVPAYITLQLYSKDEVPDPDNPNPDYCRYLRVFRNTGRVVTARTIDALPE